MAVVELIETRMKITEDRLHHIDNVVQTINAMQSETLSMVHKNSITLAEVCVLQKSSQEDIKDLFHDQKSTKAAIKMDQEKRDEELRILREKILRADVHKEVKAYHFKQWHMLLLLAIALFGAAMSIYDRLLEIMN